MNAADKMQGQVGAQALPFSGVPGPPQISAVALTCSYLQETTELPLGQRLRIVVEVLRSLHAIHSDVLQRPAMRHHGALSPRRILIDEEGRASLLRDPLPGGGPGYDAPYAAPEVRRGIPPDHKSDIYSAGVLLYEALAGRHLGEELTDTAPTPTSSGTVRKRDCPLDDPLYDVALKAMLRSPEERFDSVKQLAEQVAKIAGPRLDPRQDLGAVVTRELAELQRKHRVSSGIEPILKAPVPSLGPAPSPQPLLVPASSEVDIEPDEPPLSSDLDDRETLEMDRPVGSASGVAEPVPARSLSATAIRWALGFVTLVVVLALGYWLGRGAGREVADEVSADSVELERTSGFESSSDADGRNPMLQPSPTATDELSATNASQEAEAMEQPLPSASGDSAPESLVDGEPKPVKRMAPKPDPFDFGF